MPDLVNLNEIQPFKFQKLDGVNVCLNGYFQSYKYFDDIFSRIRPLLTFPISSYCESTSMHFRRGDYAQLPHIHPMQDVAYYTKALNIIQPKSVLYFCEDNDLSDVLQIILQLEQTVEFIRGTSSK